MSVDYRGMIGWISAQNTPIPVVYLLCIAFKKGELGLGKNWSRGHHSALKSEEKV